MIRERVKSGLERAKALGKTLRKATIEAIALARFDAATCRIRWPVLSRSNWAKDSSMLRVSLPMLVVVLKACVTEMKETPCASNSSTS